MVVNGCHQEHPIAGHFEVSDLNYHAERFDNEQPANDHENDLVLCSNCDGPQGAAKCERARVAHEHSRRRSIVPQEAQTAPYEGCRKNQDLACTGHVVNIEIAGEIDATHRVGNDAQRSGRDHNGHDRQPIKTIGQIHRVGGTRNNEHAEGDEEPAHVDQNVFEKRQCQLAREFHGMHPGCHNACNACDQKPNAQTHTAGKTCVTVCRDFLVVIQKTDETEAYGHEKQHPDVTIVEPRPEQGGKNQRGQDQ